MCNVKHFIIYPECVSFIITFTLCRLWYWYSWWLWEDLFTCCSCWRVSTRWLNIAFSIKVLCNFLIKWLSVCLTPQKPGMSKSSPQHWGRLQQKGQLWQVCSIYWWIWIKSQIWTGNWAVFAFPGPLCTTLLPIVTTSAYLLWWGLGPASMT